MLALLVRRIAASLGVLVFVTFLVFLVVYLSPGDATAVILGQGGSEAQASGLRHAYGLDRGFLPQYGDWLAGIFQGRFGTSITQHVPALDIMLPAYRNTFLLALASLAISLVLGVAVGVGAGLRPDGWFDRLTSNLVEVLAATPVFWLAIILIAVLSRHLHWLPSSGMHNLRGAATWGDLLAHLVLPAVSASVLAVAIVARLTRASVIEAAESDYAKMFAAAGMSKARIFRTQMLRNILPPVVSIGGLQFGSLFSGVIFVETVFAWPGLSAPLYNAITAHDVPVIQTGVLLIAATFVLINLGVDLVLLWLNPRARA